MIEILDEHIDVGSGLEGSEFDLVLFHLQFLSCLVGDSFPVTSGCWVGAGNRKQITQRLFKALLHWWDSHVRRQTNKEVRISTNRHPHMHNQ